MDLNFAHGVCFGQIARVKDHAARFSWLPGLVQRHNFLPLLGRYIID
jgi:hypothetical protein